MLSIQVSNQGNTLQTVSVKELDTSHMESILQPNKPYCCQEAEFTNVNRISELESFCKELVK